jgi:hypothetical protein
MLGASVRRIEDPPEDGKDNQQDNREGIDGQEGVHSSPQIPSLRSSLRAMTATAADW